MRHAAVRNTEHAAPSTATALSLPLHLPVPGDDELIARLQRGDTLALDAILAKYWTPVVDYIARFTGAQDFAEDVAQRAFCQLWDRRTDWRIAGSLRALLYRMARNTAASDRRRDGARERSDAAFAMMPRRNPTPADLLDDAQLRAQLERAIAALPARRREVFVLRCVHGLSYDEIAKVLDLSPQTVANQVSSALRTLRIALQAFLD